MGAEARSRCRCQNPSQQSPSPTSKVQGSTRTSTRTAVRGQKGGRRQTLLAPSYIVHRPSITLPIRIPPSSICLQQTQTQTQTHTRVTTHSRRGALSAYILAFSTFSRPRPGIGLAATNHYRSAALPLPSKPRASFPTITSPHPTFHRARAAIASGSGL